MLAASKLNIRHEIWSLQTVFEAFTPHLIFSRQYDFLRLTSLQVPGSHLKLLGAAPLLHYHVEVKVQSMACLCLRSLLQQTHFPNIFSCIFAKVGANGGSWQKGRDGAGENYIWPVPLDADQVA